MIIDIFTAILVSLGFYLGYQRGLIKTIFDTLSLIIGVLAALKLSPIVIKVLQSSFDISPAITFILGIAITFLLVMILIRFIGKKLEDLLEAVHINFVNKIAGGLLQALFFSVLLAYGVGLMDKVGMVKQNEKDKSFTYSYLGALPPLSQSLFNAMKPVFIDFWNITTSTMDKIKSKAETTESENPKQ
jgi:membrane protein required for colicin V production